MIPINHLTIGGNLTRDPEIRFLANERCVANFTVANSRRFKSGEETREETTFLDCQAWGETGERIGKYFTKGKPVIVEGRLKQETWKDKEGNNRSKMVLVVERFHFVPDGKRGEGKADADAPAATRTAAPSTAPASAASGKGDDEPPF